MLNILSVHINFDIFKYLTRNYALTIRNELTKFTQAFLLISKKTFLSFTFSLYCDFCKQYGTPICIHCDYGCEFDKMLFKDLNELYDFKITFSSVNHPQSNGSINKFIVSNHFIYTACKFFFNSHYSLIFSFTLSMFTYYLFRLSESVVL